jgi:hypothetical protein
MFMNCDRRYLVQYSFAIGEPHVMTFNNRNLDVVGACRFVSIAC